MAGAGTAIVVIIGLVLVLSILGIGADFFADIQASLKEQQEQQNDQADAELMDVGNFAKDTGTRVCNLRVDFLGGITKTDIYGFNLFGDELFIFMGDHGGLAEFLSFGGLEHDKRIINYQWFCTGEPKTASLLFWNYQKNIEPLSFLDRFDGEIIRIKFEAFSKDTGKNMFDKTGKIQFQARQTLPVDAEGVVALQVSIFLEGVTEDDYTVKFYSESARIGVGDSAKELGHKFSYDLCKPSLTSC